MLVEKVLIEKCVGAGKCGGEEGVKPVNFKAIILGFF